MGCDCETSDPADVVGFLTRTTARANIMTGLVVFAVSYYLGASGGNSFVVAAVAALI